MLGGINLPRDSEDYVSWSTLRGKDGKELKSICPHALLRASLVQSKEAVRAGAKERLCAQTCSYDSAIRLDVHRRLAQSGLVLRWSADMCPWFRIRTLEL